MLIEVDYFRIVYNLDVIFFNGTYLPYTTHASVHHFTPSLHHVHQRGWSVIQGASTGGAGDLNPMSVAAAQPTSTVECA